MKIILTLLIIPGVGIFTIPFTSIAFGEEVITILPSAADHNRPRFLDITFYPIEEDKQLTWFNDDDTRHRIIINTTTQDNSTEILTESEVIEPNSSFSYTFGKEGTYHFYSPIYPWIKGTVFVSDDISTITETDSKNDIDVQLTWSPSLPKVGQEAKFKIIFENTDTEKNQEHIDYRFSIQKPDGKKVDLQSPHSGWGVESAAYTFEEEGEFKPRISIFNVNFIPVEVGVEEFELVTSAASE